MVKQGYKQTEIGVIPEDWEVKELGELGSVIIGLTYSPNDVSEYGTLVLRSSNIQNGRLSFENNVFVKMNLPERVIVKENDLLICVRNGSRNLIGKCAIIDKKTEGSAFGAFMSVFRSDFNRYVSEVFKSDLIQKQIENNLGATINQITNKDLNSFQIPLPPLPEQEAIAEALSDADAWIESLEQLIAKKRLIKQGAMQELLTPKEDWEVKKLGEVAIVTGAGVDKKIIDGEKSVTLLNYLDVYRRDYIYRKELGHQVTAPTNKIEQCDIRKGDVLITPSSELPNDIGITALAMEDMPNVVYSYHLYRIRFLKEFDWKFRLYLFKNRFFLNQAEKFAEGSGKRYVISLSKVREFDIAYPKSLSEQTRIATILSDMDAEIEALEQKLSKARQIKQGMMQELLTGRIRLV